MDKQPQKWCYSIGNDDFQGGFDSKLEAAMAIMADYRYCEPNDWVKIGVIKEYEPKIDVNLIYAQIQEQARAALGSEIVGNYLNDVSDEDTKVLEKMLNKAFETWSECFGHKPDFFEAEDIEEFMYRDIVDYVRKNSR